MVQTIVVDGPLRRGQLNKRYRYYITHASALRESEPEALRIPAHDIEAAVVHQLGELLRDRLRIRNLVTMVDGSASALANAITLASGKAAKLAVPHHRRAIVGAVVKQVVVEDRQLTIAVDVPMLLGILGLNGTATHPDLMLTAPSVRMRTGKAVKLLLNDAGPSLNQDTTLIELLREARDAQRLALGAPEKSIRTLATEHGKCSTRMGRLLRLSWLAPSIVESIVSGEYLGRLTARALLETDLPVSWDEQRKLLTMP